MWNCIIFLYLDASLADSLCQYVFGKDLIVEVLLSSSPYLLDGALGRAYQSSLIVLRCILVYERCLDAQAKIYPVLDEVYRNSFC